MTTPRKRPVRLTGRPEGGADPARAAPLLFLVRPGAEPFEPFPPRATTPAAEQFYRLLRLGVRQGVAGAGAGPAGLLEVRGTSGVGRAEFGEEAEARFLAELAGAVSESLQGRGPAARRDAAGAYDCLVRYSPFPSHENPGDTARAADYVPAAPPTAEHPLPSSPLPPSPAPGPADALRSAVQQWLQGLPADPATRLEAFEAGVDAAKAVLVSEAERLLNLCLDALAPRDRHAQLAVPYERKYELAALVNALLDRVGAAILFGGQMCSLYVVTKANYPRGQFVLVKKGGSKQLAIRTHLTDLLPIRLTGLDPGPRTWADRVATAQSQPDQSPPR